MMFRVTDLMIEAAAAKKPKPGKGKEGCTLCTQCTHTGASTCTDTSGRGDPCTPCSQQKPGRKARALSDLHVQLHAALMAQA